MKKTLALIIAFVLLLSVSACGKQQEMLLETTPDGELVTDADGNYIFRLPEFTMDGLSEEDIADVPSRPDALPIDTMLSDRSFDSRYYADGDAGLPVLTGDSLNGGTNVDIVLRMTDSSGAKGFAFVLRTCVDSLYSVDSGNKAEVSFHACCNDTYLFSVDGYTDGNEAFYLFDNENGVLFTLGRMKSLRITGNVFVARPADANGENDALLILNWQGETLYTYPAVQDYDRWENDLYLITEGDAPVLIRVGEDAFYAATPDFTGETLCEMGDYTGAFGVYNYGVMTLVRKDGGDLRIVDIGNAAQELKKLAASPVQGYSAVTESCNAFSVTLPGFWTDRYVCNKSDDGMAFYMVRDGGDPLSLFSFRLMDKDEALDSIGSAVFIAFVEGHGDARLLAVNAVQAYPGDGEDGERYWAMLSSMDAVAESLTAHAGSVVTRFDFSSYLGTYKGMAENGGEYRLTVSGAENNLISALLSLPTDDGTEEREVYAFMLGTEGIMLWATDEEDADVGLIRLSDEGVLLRFPNGEGIDSTEILLKKLGS